MVKVSNGKCIRHLGFQAMKAARLRNLVAILAIALTTVLFTSLFTVAMSLNDAFQQSNFRQVGGYSHGAFKYLTEEQFDQIKTDPLIREWGLRRFVGMPEDEPFRKSHVEIGYSDAAQAHWMFCDPVEGRLPAEGTNEAATDTRVLELLGVTPALGAEFTVTFLVDKVETTQTFTLCGWWAYDEAIFANHILIPESRVDAILDEVGVTPPGGDGMTGSWNLDVMLKSTFHIEQDMVQILENHGYQNDDRTQWDNYIATGVNWGYTGAQLADSLDPMMVLAIAAILSLIIFTGYLIIYNVFQISVTNDIRFYGLLKTIGTTGRQLKRIIRQQALMLSAVGIPVGLFLGWLVGRGLTPVILTRLNDVNIDVVSLNPLIFIGSALFSLLTVAISCRRPGRMAAKVSPIEAVRYTEGNNLKKKEKKSKGGVSLVSMAWANLGRSRSKTAVTMASLALAVVMMNLTASFTGGFDMDKYIAMFVASDFVAANASYFQTGNPGFSEDRAIPEEAITAIETQGITEGGRTYGASTWQQEFVTEDYFRAANSRWMPGEVLEGYVADQPREADGKIADDVQLYGMERFPLEQLDVVEGDISKLLEPGGRYVAAVYSEDDYGNLQADSHWAKLGDTVKIRYVEEFQNVDMDTGEVVTGGDLENCRQEPTRFRDVEYEVAALVLVPHPLSYRYFGSDEFVMNDQTFMQDTGTDDVLYYAFNTTDEGNAAMEAFLADYTENQNANLDYESKATYAAEFESFRSMFVLLGGALSFIVGLVGVLNFFNAILTGILTRRREFAVLQSIGMTGRQLKAMLVWEGCFYALGSVVLALVLSVILGPVLGTAVGGMFWFFTYYFTVTPVLLVTPLFALLGMGLPLIAYRFVSRATVVERLRESE